MRILDQNLCGGLHGTMAGGNNGTVSATTSQNRWALFLMRGQEPQTVSQASQVFDINDITYLYNECVGIVPQVINEKSTTPQSDTISLHPTRPVWYKGLNYFDGKLSIAIPDKIVSNEYTQRTISILFGMDLDQPRPASNLPKDTTITYNSPINLKGFLVTYGSSAHEVYVNGTKLSLTHDSNNPQLLLLANPITTSEIVFKAGNGYMSYTPLSVDLPSGTVEAPDYFVLAPLGRSNGQNQPPFVFTSKPEFPYLISKLGDDLEDMTAHAFIIGKRRSKSIICVLRSIQFRGMY